MRSRRARYGRERAQVALSAGSRLFWYHFNLFMDTFASTDITNHAEVSIGKIISSEGGWPTIVNIVLLTVAMT
jgi:hypothetical protein